MTLNSLKPLPENQWPPFMARHDLAWSRIGGEWEQGAFLGNGMLGAMVYRESPSVLRWEMGRCDVVERFQVPLVDWAPPRLPIGDFLLETVGSVVSEQMRLDLWNAEARGTIQTDRGRIRWRSLVHAVDMALLVEYEVEGGEQDATLTFRPKQGVSPCLHYDRIRKKVDPDWLARHTPPAPETLERGGLRFAVQDYLAGGQYATGWTLVQAGPARRLLATVASTYPLRHAVAAAAGQLDAPRAADPAAWIESHQAWWHEYYPRSFLSLDDPYWESFYWIQMYKLASATREEGALIDSQGPWMPQTPWPTCVWNLNVQTSYSPLFTANRHELGESLYRMLDRSLPDLIMNVPDPFRGDSAGIGRSTSCVGLRAATSPGWETGNLAWACFNYYRHYRCDMDDGLLRDRLYPLLRRAVNYYFHLAEEGPDGRLHLMKSVSPEYGPDQCTRDCNYDLALFQWGCRTLLRITARLGIDDERRADWERVLEQLAEPPVDEFGLRVGRDIGFRRSHRHYSHLFAVWPLRIWNIDHPEFRSLAEQSVAHWLSLDKELQGYTWTSASCMASGFGDGDAALERLNRLKPYLQPNTMYAENGPVIETPLSAAESIHDMLLQSWSDPLADGMSSVLRVFPAVPSTWRNLVFRHLRAEGAFLVSACRRNGQTAWIQVESLAGEPCIVQTDLADPVAADGAEPEPLGPGRWRIRLQEGESVLLHPRGETPDTTLQPVQRDPAQENLFGMAGASHQVHGGKLARDPAPRAPRKD